LKGLAVLLLAIVPLTATAKPPTIEEEVCAKTKGLDPKILALAMRAHARASVRGEAKGHVITVIDYSKSSREKRLWVIDLEARTVLFHELVAHGKNSGGDVPSRFSNEPESQTSSIGLFVTSDTYEGKHGYSLKLRGLDSGLNDKAEARAIVMHGAHYVNLDFAAKHGRLGRSWGCPALAPDVAGRVIDVIKGGTAVFAYFPDPKLERSTYLTAD
jgi:hypothetical protein